MKLKIGRKKKVGLICRPKAQLRILKLRAKSEAHKTRLWTLDLGEWTWSDLTWNHLSSLPRTEFSGLGQATAWIYTPTYGLYISRHELKFKTDGKPINKKCYILLEFGNRIFIWSNLKSSRNFSHLRFSV